MDPLIMSSLINAGSNVLGRAMTPTPGGPAVSGLSGNSFVQPSTGAFSVATGGGGTSSATSTAPSASAPSPTGACQCGQQTVAGFPLQLLLILGVAWVVMKS